MTNIKENENEVLYTTFKIEKPDIILIDYFITEEYNTTVNDCSEGNASSE